MKKKNRMQLLAILMACTLCLQTFPALAEEHVQTQSEEPQTVQTDAAINAMTDDAYKDFGVDVNSNIPAEFDESDTTNPLEGYQTQILSELYLGEMNRKEAFTGSFKVMDNVTDASGTSFNITQNMSNTLIGGEVVFDAHKNNNSIQPQTQNASGIDCDGDGQDEIVDTTLYVKSGVSYMDISLYDRQGEGNWQKKNTMTMTLSNEKSQDIDFVEAIEADSSKAFTAITAGDFNQDGIEECAVYMPSYGIEEPCVLILSAAEGKLTQLQKIRLSELSSNFEMTYVSWKLPAVSLATTQISGQDDLVISASLPMRSGDDYKKSNQDSITSICHYNQDSKQMDLSFYSTFMKDKDGNRMRFASAVDTDLNGNGVKELLIGGYQNYGYSDDNPVGKISGSKNMIMLVCWDTALEQYCTVWNEPKTVTALTDNGLDVGKEVMEPVAMAAGAFSRGSETSQVFLEGVVFKYTNMASKAAKEQDYFISGDFVKTYQMKLSGTHDAFISTATAANFASNQISQDQLVILTGDHNSLNSDLIFYDIGWIWESGGLLTGKITDNDYINKKNEDDDGTFLSLCALDVDTDTIHVKYTGKDFGWSKPTLYSIIQSPPYWKELQYPQETFGAGGSSMEISVAHGSATEGEWGVGLGMYIGASAMIGAGFLGTKMQAGGGAEFEFMGSYLGSYCKRYESEDSLDIRVAPGEDYVVLLTIPVVSYHYEMLVPGHYATQQDVDSYEELESDQICPFKAGDWIEESTEDMNVSVQLDQTFSWMTVEKYNEMVHKHENEGLSKIDETSLASKQIGDPSTYPSTEDEITAHGDVKNLSVVQPSANIVVGETEIGISHSETVEKEQSNGFEVEYDHTIFGKAEVEAELFVSTKLEGEFGVHFTPSGGCQFVHSSSQGIKLSGSIAGLPKGADAYGFSTNLVFYNASNIGVGDTDDKNLENGPYVLGYMVTGLEGNNVPSIPENLRVFSTTAHEVALKWDSPTTEGRIPGSYKLHMKDNLGNEHPLLDQENQPIVISGNQNYYVVTDLDPATTYEFAIRSFGDSEGTSNPSVVSRYINAVTKESGNPYFTTQPQNECLTWSDEAPETNFVTFTAEAVSDGKNAKPLTYQWQKYVPSTLTGGGTFENLSDDDFVSGSTTGQLKIALNTDNKEQYMEPTYYRLIATEGGRYSAYSRTATLYLNDAEGMYDYHNLDMKLSMIGEHVYRMEDEYHTMENQTFTVNASVANMDNPADTAMMQDGGIVDFYAVGSAGNMEFIGSAAIENKVASLEVQDSIIKDTKDTYDIRAFYQGGTIGTDTRNYYLPTISDTARLYVGQLDAANDYCSIVYHLNGGSISLSNPTALTMESQSTKLDMPVKYGSEFVNWYLDESLSEESAITTIGLELLRTEMTQIDVYAGWRLTEFPITYELNGGINHTANPSVYTIESGKITLENPQREGYEFIGWYSDAALTDACSVIKSCSVGDQTFYAKWEERKAFDPLEGELCSLQEGDLFLCFGDDYMGKFTFTKSGDGWTIQNSNGDYLTQTGGVFNFSSEAEVWSYYAGSFYQTEKSTSRWWWMCKTNYYYLAEGDDGFAVTTSNENTAVSLYTNETEHEHEWSAWYSIGNGQHERYCSLDDERERGFCDFNNDEHICPICGAEDPAYKSIDVQVSVTKRGSWSWFRYKTYYIASVTTEATGTTVDKVEYSTDNTNWTCGMTYQRSTAITELYIRVTDTEGAQWLYEYKNGTVTALS